VVTFGVQRSAIVQGRVADGALQVRTPDAEYSVQLRVLGEHNLHNALAACAAGHALQIPVPAIVAGLAEYSGAKGRLQVKPGRNGSKVIDDTYNANPDSVLAAIDVLGAMRGTRILVLGDMGELGAEGVALHTQVGAAARKAGIDRLLALGELSKAAVAAFGSGAAHFADLDALCAALAPQLDRAVAVLVKGSRFMRMERVVERLVEPGAATAHVPVGDR
jgi:UDP-N-acetylmuramoyl-tripeptide--D-alanyl-D-alanine ligase